MKYRLFFESPHKHLIRIEMALAASGDLPRQIRLSKWRPGRYELGPYIENIIDLQATTSSGTPLQVQKTAYNHWQVAPSGTETVTLQYKYHAIAPDAGASFFDERQVYINGVNLFLYDPARIDDPCEVTLELPGHYRIACGMQTEGNTLYAADFHELVDSPFIASPSLQHRAFQLDGTTHNLWFQGEVKPDFARIEHDFRLFGAAQIALFGDFPVPHYHYLFQIHNRHFYHGVEHQTSTVLAFGPGIKLMQPEMYQELLGLCCHELFHTWNVKAIRPADMVPYDYDNHNYSRLHYVTEGVTTYYGDLMLLKAGVWPLTEYLHVFNESILRKHYASNGRDHISLEDASFDSWLNGYKPGVPNRKISFYTKGCLAAFVLDYLIRRGSKNTRSLDTVMREMYQRFGKTGIGYTREDYKAIAEAHASISLDDYFSDYISGTLPMEPILQEAAAYFGLELVHRRVASTCERLWGFGIDEAPGNLVVKQIWEGSPAERHGLSLGDEIVAVNTLRAGLSNWEALLSYPDPSSSIELQVFRSDILQTITLQHDPHYHLERFMLVPLASPSLTQLANLTAWIQVG